ncbi:cation channel sperm-associated protein 4 isoform X2 [Lepisosteus oculatus]|uniref:cation channel sperm-associated protein 4 isoform X2 n=1 Tax=Lepisosteus oculatus TaxID=7918 RepID=UPI0035F522DF
MESRTFSKVHTRRGSEWRVRKGSIPDADEEVEVTDFKAIFQVKDDSHIETYVSQELVGAVLDHFLFKIFIMASIVGNSIIIAFQTSPFIAEDGWNILDFMIIASLIVGPAVMSPGSTNVLRILRVLRVIRSIRGFAALRGVAMMVQVILQSIPDMANIFLLLVIIMLVFAVFGVTLFGVAVPSAFGDLATAMYSLFICITQDGWMSIYQQFQTEEEGLMYGAAVYFFVFLTGGAFIFANLLVAVVTTNLELAMAEYDEHSSSQGDDKVALTQKQLEEDSVTDIDTVHLEEVLRETKMTQRQKPYKYSCLENLTIESYEEFCMVLEAIQKNIKDYQKIRQELNSIVGEVQGISFNQEQEQEVIMRNKQASLLQDNLLMNEIATGRTGDMLSTLMILEKANIIDSASPSPALYQKGTVLQAAMKAKRKSIC